MGLLLFTLCLLCACSGGELAVAVLTSSSTPPETTEMLANNVYGAQREVTAALGLEQPLAVYWETVDLRSAEAQFYFPRVIARQGLIVFLDATNCSSYSQFLAYEAYLQNLLHIVVDRPLDSLHGESLSPNTLFLESSRTAESLAIAALVRHYGWVNIGLLYTQRSQHVEMATTFKAALKGVVTILDEVVVDAADKATAVRVQQRLTSTTKYTGACVIVVLADAVTAAQLLSAGDEGAMGGAGYAWILSSEAMLHIGEIARLSNAGKSELNFAVLRTGAIGFVQEDLEYRLQEPMYHYTAALTVAGLAYQRLGGFTTELSGTEIRDFFLSSPEAPALPFTMHFTPDGMRQVNYTLYNIYGFSLYEVGQWVPATSELTLGSRSIVWPGNEPSAPDDTVTVIKIVLLYPRTTASGEEYAQGKAILNSFTLALEEINSDLQLLSKYLIEAVELNTAMTQQLAEVYTRLLANSNVVGFVGPMTSEIAKAFIAADSHSADSKPFVSYGATATDLTKYPRFLRIVQPDGFQAVAIAMFLQRCGWKRVGVVYTNDDYGLGVYSSFLLNAPTLEISIANDEEKRRIEPASGELLTEECLQSIDAALKDLVEKQVRIIVYLGSWRAGVELVRRAKAKELVGSRYAWVGGKWLSDEVLSRLPVLYPNNTAEVLEVLDGAIALGELGVSGERGAAFQQAYSARFPGEFTPYSVLAYDALYVFARAINAMVSQGEDFAVGKDLADMIRRTEFIGASGKVQFAEGTNDRSAYGYAVYNFQKDKLVKLTHYEPLNPNIFANMTAEVRWYKGTDQPHDEFAKYDCPFALHMVTISMEGVFTLMCIGLSLFLVTLVLSIVSYTRWREVEIEDITAPVVRTWKDTFVQLTIGIEFFQLVAIAPTFESLQIVVESASNVFMIDAIRAAKQGKSGYWTELVIVCLLCYLWFFLVVLIMLNAESWLKRVSVFKRVLAMLSDLYLPFIGNTMFLPFTALLLDPFICDHQAQGHAFVWRDCYMTCWTPLHIRYVAMSSLAILSFVTLAVYSRPLWQQAKTGVNVISKPFYLLFKTSVQVLLIAVGKSLQGTFPLAHGIVFTALMVAFSFVSYRTLPFNYSRFNLWSFSSMVAVLYISLLSTVSRAGNPSSVGWFIALVAGWILIAIAAFIVQKKYVPNLLVPPGGLKGAGDNNSRKVRDILPGQALHIRSEAHAEEADSLNIIAPSATPDANSDSLVSSQLSSQRDDRLESERSDIELKPQNRDETEAPLPT